jgi:hypothetical protein
MAFARRTFAVMTIAALLAAGCSDPTGPMLTDENVFVHVDAATVPLVVADAFNSLTLRVPLTLTNNSARTVYINGYCLLKWQRLEAGEWIEVFPSDCAPGEILPIAVFPRRPVQVFYGQTVSAPHRPAPPFPLPGTYRFRIAFYLDSRVRKSAGDELGLSNAFAVVPP